MYKELKMLRFLCILIEFNGSIFIPFFNFYDSDKDKKQVVISKLIDLIGDSDTVKVNHMIRLLVVELYTQFDSRS